MAMSSIGMKLAVSIVLTATQISVASAQVSVGRGAPVIDTSPRAVGAGGPLGVYEIAAENGAVPPGVAPLPRDLFTSDDFYKDRALWSDPRYFRCNSPIGLEAAGGAYPETTSILGDDPPRTGPWGFCDRDYPREAIVSPYPFESAKAHYEALLEETNGRGGPTRYTVQTVPDWSGQYVRSHDLRPPFEYQPPEYPYWIHAHLNQMSTYISLLTPEYQTRAVQQAYHYVHDNAAQWPASYCWPEGFLRWYSPSAGTIEVISRPERLTLIGGIIRTFVRQVHIERAFTEDGGVAHLGEAVPRWYGETIGFWDGDALITWTSNLQGWTAHGWFEFSNRMQTIEIYTPRHDDGGRLAALDVETVFYDPEALAQPVRLVQRMRKTADLADGEPIPFLECMQTIWPIDGIATPASPGAEIEITVPDWFGRPWAQLWEKYFEEGMERPSNAMEELFDFE
jgi:hypothetical protein